MTHARPGCAVLHGSQSVAQAGRTDAGHASVQSVSQFSQFSSVYGMARAPRLRSAAWQSLSRGRQAERTQVMFLFSSVQFSPVQFSSVYGMAHARPGCAVLRGSQSVSRARCVSLRGTRCM
eukprot:gene16829-biopygen6346